MASFIRRRESAASQGLGSSMSAAKAQNPGACCLDSEGAYLEQVKDIVLLGVGRERRVDRQRSLGLVDADVSIAVAHRCEGGARRWRRDLLPNNGGNNELFSSSMSKLLSTVIFR